MDILYADHTISVSEHKKNPTETLKAAHGMPVVVLNHNKPAFYVVSPEHFARMSELLENHELRTLAKERLKSRRKAVDVDIEDL